MIRVRPQAILLLSKMSVVIARGLVESAHLTLRERLQGDRDYRRFASHSGSASRDYRYEQEAVIDISLRALEHRIDFLNFTQYEVKIVALVQNHEDDEDTTRLSDGSVAVVNPAINGAIEALVCSAVVYGCHALAVWAAKACPRRRKRTTVDHDRVTEAAITAGLLPGEMATLRSGAQVIQVIKGVRARIPGCGLKEAKDMVDAYRLIMNKTTD